MKKGRKNLLIFFLLAVLSLTLLGCSFTPYQQTGVQNNNPMVADSHRHSKPLEGIFVTILTGGSSGVYFPLGGALAGIYKEKLGASATFQSTSASAENCFKLARGEGELAFAMADTVADAYYGEGRFQGNALKNLRAVSAMYSNYFHVVTTAENNISSLKSLRGKRVAVGAHGSGTEINAKRVLNAAGITYAEIEEQFLSFAEAIQGLQEGTIDVAILSSGIPNAAISKLSQTEEIILIPIQSELVSRLQQQYPAYNIGAIPGGTYEGIANDVITITVKNLLITHEGLSDEMVYQLTKAFFENLDTLRETHSAANSITLEKALEGLPIPLHPGAKRYYQEQGILRSGVSR
ncbi:TAXI family TRAP transporter solute-binding subunit [Calderihabitans maritimus]|uniref:TRAP transporter solute receptor, TAXI family n=1 Tax=Calderihabitans maritimus TaxID=1246530 RepID=A0A1Z5HPZ3_9FIRM|nr:TAXI family TRAP transporter solute-binding subunit [Calderihabitans maritimus]GAW91584.1 hypothetical protein KKC1_07450 [Calderihabitans maritimus]